MSTLYEIDKAITDCVDAETGEIIDIERLESLQVERETKLENIGLWIKNLESDARDIKAEEVALAERRKAKENRAANLREYLAHILDGQNFETPRLRLSFRSSTGVEFSEPEETLHFLEQHYDSCIKYKAPEISKSAVAKLLKDGVEVPGAELVKRQNLQIK